jgi:hypothetical protein
MPAIQNLRRANALVAAAVSFVVVGAVVVACSSNDSNPTPPEMNYPVDASNTLPDVTTAGDETSTTTPGDEASTADVVEEPIPRDAACLIDRPAAQGAPSSSSCWNCTPGLNTDFLNHCAATGVTCVPFDNSRLPGYDGGALPSTN